MKDKRTIEFYINNKLYKTCSYDKWNETDKYINSLIDKGGYFQVHNESMYRQAHLWDKKVFVNPFTFKCIQLSHKINTGYVDKFGNKLYEDDTVKTPYGFDSKLNCHWDDTKYYVREFREFGTWKDYDVVDFTTLEKVKDVIDIPQEHWNKPKRITIKTL